MLWILVDQLQSSFLNTIVTKQLLLNLLIEFLFKIEDILRVI